MFTEKQRGKIQTMLSWVATDAAAPRFAKQCASSGLVIAVVFHGMERIYGCTNWWGEEGARTVQIKGASWSQ